MSTKEMKKKGVATFEGMNISKAGLVTVKFKLRYDEILTSVGLLEGLNKDITVRAKVGGGKAKSLGLFTIGAINFDRDGNAVIPFKALAESVNLDNICDIVDEELIQLDFLSVFELPENSARELEQKEESEETESEGWDEGGEEDWEED